MQNYRPPTYFKQGRYHTLGVLGTGTYGQVIRCRDEQSGKEVAVKVAQQNQAYRLSALNEIRALQALQSCPDAVDMLDCFEEGGHVCIVTELLYKNLYDILRAQNFEPLGVHDIRHVALHLLRALAALHQAGYMHCDVKPENIMLRFSPAASTAQQESYNNASILGEKYSYYALQEQAVNFPYKSHAQAHQPLPGNFAAPTTAATSLSSSATSYYASGGLIESPSEDNSTSTLLSEDEPLSLLNMYTHATMAAAQPASESTAYAFASAASKKAAVYTSHKATTATASSSSPPQPHHVPASTSSSVNFEATCLIDFGAVRKFSENNYFDVQSLWYRAPEVLCELPYTIGIDAWSVGCVLFELYTGKALFPGQNTQDQLARIVQLRGCPSPAALHARLASGSVQAALHAQQAGVATEAQLRRWMRRCRREAFRAVRAKARQGPSAAPTAHAHVQEQIQVSLDELLNCRNTNKSHALIDEEDEEDGGAEEEDAEDEAESELLGLILALLEPDESHRLGCSAALLHPFLTRTYYCNNSNNNSNNKTRLNYAPTSHIVPQATYQDAHASNGLLWAAHHHTTAATRSAASASGPHTHCNVPSVGHGSHNGLSAYGSSNNPHPHKTSSTTSVNVMFDEAAKTALTLPMMNPTPQNTLQASPQHTAMMNTVPHYTVLSAGPGVGHGAHAATHVLTTNELPATCSNGMYTAAATTTSTSNTSQMMGNVSVMHTMNTCLPSQQAPQSNNNNTTITSTNSNAAATTAQMFGLLMQPTMNNSNNNNNMNTTMAYNSTQTQGVLQYQAMPHNNSNSNNNMLTTPTTNTTSVLDMSSPLYNMHTGSTSFAALGQDMSRQQQQQQQQQHHAMQCMAVNEPCSQSDGRLNIHQDMNSNANTNNNNNTATTVFMPMAMSPVMYYQPVPMTLQAMQPRLELPGSINNNDNNISVQQQQQQQQHQHAHVTYSAVLATPGSMQPIATQPSQASSIYPCYVSTEQTPNYAGHLTTSTSMNMASTSAPVRRDLDERTMQRGVMLQMPSATAATTTANTTTTTTAALSSHPYAAQSHYSRLSGYSCLAQDSYGGRMDGMYYFNVSLPLTQQQTILLSSS